MVRCAGVVVGHGGTGPDIWDGSQVRIPGEVAAVPSHLGEFA